MILRDRASSRILAMSIHTERTFVQKVFRAGACGYILMNHVLDELYPAILAVYRGQTFLSPEFRGAALEQREATGGRRLQTTLTQREREIIQLIAEGHSSRDIAGRLHISVRTVDTHRRAIMAKLELRSVAQLTKYAIREGLTFL